jgi:DNA (cytosine-5)-methyltransferase 1
LKCGSLFSGILGLDTAVCEFFGAELAWTSEVEPGPCKVIERHGVPNLGDITKIDWSEVEPVDILCGGFPCQDISYAGKGAGIRSDTRSGLWYEFARAIRDLRPRFVVVENVSALLSRGMGIVLGDLAEMGFDAEWCSVRASDAGAPHRRERIFILAADASRERHDQASADADGGRREQHRKGIGELPVLGADRTPPPDASGERLREHAGEPPAEEARSGAGDEPADRGRARPPGDGRAASWGSYEPAIRRWERTLGRPAPAPTDDRGRLSPAFVEWMMGLPAGHVDGLTRTQALKALGNAVVPQQALLALRQLTRREALDGAP